MSGGLYALAISLRRARSVRVGALGVLRFDAGLYIYVGSARKNIDARLARHRRRDKARRWHIDYLRRHCRWEGAFVFNGVENECDLRDMIAKASGGSVAHRGFGSSDCGCEGHLVLSGTTLFGELADRIVISARGVLVERWPSAAVY